MPDIAFGASKDPTLPPVNLPSFDDGSRPIPRIVISPRQGPAGPGGSQGDPWAAFPDAPGGAAPAQAAPQQAAAGSDPWAAFPDAPAAAPANQRQTTVQEAQLGGVKNALTFGAAPAISGLAEASGIEAPDMTQQHPAGDLGSITDAVKFFGRPFVGAAKVIINSMADHPDPAVQDAYQRGRQAALDDQKLQQEQHPSAFLAGQLAGALMGPAFGAMKGATVVGRIGRGALAGGTAGGIYGAGSSLSNNEGIADTAINAGEGALTGAAFGAGGAGAAEGLGAVGGKVAQLVRGQQDPEAEAARRVVGALSSDFERNGPKLSSSDIQVANEAGSPRMVVDVGGERTRALMRSAANTSPEARQTLDEAVKSRFADQATRVGAYIRRLTGSANAADDTAALQAAARRANKPRYKAAYGAGDRPLWSPRLEQIAGTPAVQRAAARAVEQGQNRAMLDGFGAFNPKVKVTPDGRVLFPRGPNGVPTYPNLQFWDYVQRELSDAAGAAGRAGRNQDAAVLGGIHTKLTHELDRLVPEFKTARGTAATFFGARDALEAGQKFVMSTAKIGEARRALAAMTPAERELFARGFASDLADKVERTGFNRDVLNSIFLNSGPALEKIRMALGSSRARQLEALLRVEGLLDAPRKALGNSTTARQLAEMGLAGGAVAGFEGLKEHDFNPTHIIAAALTVGAARHGAKVIDENVARRVGELLASNDRAVLAKGIKIVTSSPVLFNALRAATSATARVGAHEIGARKAFAGTAALVEAAEPRGHEAPAAEDMFSQ